MGIIPGYRPGVYDTSYIDHTRTQPGETAPPVDFSSIPGFETYSTADAAMSGLSKLGSSPSMYPPRGGGGGMFTGHGTGRVLAEEGVTLPDNFDLSQYTAGGGGENRVGEYASLARQIADTGGGNVHMFGDSNSPVFAPALANYLDGGGRSTFNQAYADAAANFNTMTTDYGTAIQESQDHLATFAADAGFDPTPPPDSVDDAVYDRVVNPPEGEGIGDQFAEGLPIDPRTGQPGGTHPEGGVLTSDPPPAMGGIAHDPSVWEGAGQYLEEYMPEGYYEGGVPWQPDGADRAGPTSPSLAEVLYSRGPAPESQTLGGRGEGTFPRRLPVGWTPEGVGRIDQSGRGYGGPEYGGKQYGQNDDYGLLI